MNNVLILLLVIIIPFIILRLFEKLGFVITEGIVSYNGKNITNTPLGIGLQSIGFLYMILMMIVILIILIPFMIIDKIFNSDISGKMLRFMERY